MLDSLPSVKYTCSETSKSLRAPRSTLEGCGCSCRGLVADAKKSKQ